MMEQIYKYPRTRHLEGSREQAGDEDLKTVKFTELEGKFLVLEEKVDISGTFFRRHILTPSEKKS